MIHKIFQRGKLLSSAKEIAATDDTLTLRLTSRTCSTRFAPSQYVEFKKLVVSLPLFVKTFPELCFSQMKEYMIAGKDFALGLCGVTDILRHRVTRSGNALLESNYLVGKGKGKHGAVAGRVLVGQSNLYATLVESQHCRYQVAPIPRN